jgi:hypothetical protein
MHGHEGPLDGPPDFINLIMIERGAHPLFHWSRVEGMGETRDEGAIVGYGAGYATFYTRGKRAGEINYSKPIPDTRREIVITFRDLDARKARWERETGLCQACGGSGFVVRSVSMYDGVTRQPCSARFHFKREIEEARP